MVSGCFKGILISFLVLTVTLAGCAKRPATTQASAPAPGGGAGSMQAGPASQGGEPGMVGVRSGGGPGQPGQAGGTGSVVGGPGAAGGTGGAGGSGAGGVTSGAARPVPRDFVAVPDLRDIHFDFDRYDIRPADAKTLDANAAWLKSNAGTLLLIEGHCDERGTNEYNLALGERRAKAAMNYLVSQGVQANRITIISYGEERPACMEKNEACWAKNRRAHFLIKPR
jgi:peptidoglycan-associated lipoprotein